MKINSKRKRFWAGILLVQFFLFYGLSKCRIAIHFFDGLFEKKKFFHQILASKIPFSIGDLLYIIFGVMLSVCIIKLFYRSKRAACYLKIMIYMNVFYFIYQIFWGMLYFQQPIIGKLSSNKISVTEAKSLAEKYLILCIQNRNMVKENDHGIFVITNQNILEKDVINAQKNLPKNLIEKQAVGVNTFKPSLFKFVMSYTGILGYYNPFTAEAQYNAEMPDTYIPFTLAHESSHQLGYAREQEANFVGFLIGKNTENPELKYSTNLFALKSLLRYIKAEDPAFVEVFIKRFSSGMKKDLQAERIFQVRHQGVLDKIFAVSNNLFLKSNQQEGSVTYSYFTEMLIKYDREIK